MKYIVTAYEIHQQQFMVQDANSREEAIGRVLEGCSVVVGESEFVSFNDNEENWTVTEISSKEYDAIEEYEMIEPTFENFEFIRRWTKNGFKLELFDTKDASRCVLAYRFYDNGKLIFSGTDYEPSPMFCLDSDDVVYSLLGFLSVKPGTIDKEFFKEYTKQ